MKTLLALALATSSLLHAQSPTTLVNVSYDVTREFYEDYNAAFTRHWKAGGHPPIAIDQSHGGSSKQAKAVVDGLRADVVTMNQDPDIQLIADSGLIAQDWRERLPDHAAPYTSPIVFLVRKGNPKGIEDWPDLVKPGTELVIPNPKTSGNGRYTYFAAWAHARNLPGATEKSTRDFVAALFLSVPMLAPGGRDATNAFVQRGLGDVLLTFESEALQISRVFSPGSYEIVTPSSSVLAEAPVSVVDKIVDERGTREIATAYLRHLWSDDGQKIIARHFLRPRSAEVLAAHSDTFPALKLYSVGEIFGSWPEAQKQFLTGGTFESFFQGGKP